MKKIKLFSCSICGKHIKRNENGHSRSYCKKCSSYGKKIYEAENPSFLLTNEIAIGNFDIRIREGFRLLKYLED